MDESEAAVSCREEGPGPAHAPNGRGRPGEVVEATPGCV